MEKAFKYIVIAFIICTLVGITIAINAPRPKLSFNERLKMSEIIAKCNADLPCEIGTIGYLDSVSFAEETITFHARVNGDGKIMSDNYDDFKDKLKYSLLVMNGQKNLGGIFAYLLRDKGLNICLKVCTENQMSMNWKITSDEFRTFTDSCKSSPTEALHKIMDMQIKLANLKLPLSPYENTQVASITTNSLIGNGANEDYLLQSIKHKGNDILIEYKVKENEMKDIEEVKGKLSNLNFMNAWVQNLAQNKDILELIGMLAISRSNMLLVYRGMTSGKQVSVKIPYNILRNNCNIPQELFND